MCSFSEVGCLAIRRVIIVTVGVVGGVRIHWRMTSLSLGVSTSIDIDASKHLSWFSYLGFLRFSYLGFLVTGLLWSFRLLLRLGTTYRRRIACRYRGSQSSLGSLKFWFPSPSHGEFSLPAPGPINFRLISCLHTQHQAASVTTAETYPRHL